MVKTRKPKGFHIHWLSHKQYKSINALYCKTGFEFEIHTDKRCIPVPPTTHRDDANFHYDWEVKSEIPVSEELYDVLLEILQDCLKSKPDKVLNDYAKDDSGDKKQDSREQKQDSNSKESGNGKADGLQLGDGGIEVIRKLLQPYYVDKRRNGIVFGVSGILHVEGISKDSAMALIDKIARNDGISIEVDIQKAKTIVENTFRKERQVVCGKDFFIQNILMPIIGSRDVAIEISGKIYNIIHEVQDKSIGEEERESETAWLRRNIIARFKIYTTRDKTRELFLYDERRGVYLANQEWRIEEFCQSISHDVKTGVIEEVIKSVKRITSIERSELDSNLDIINLKNGLLNIHTLEFTIHSRDHLSTVQLPIRYNPKARCPNILRFLGQVSKPKDVFTALQLLGYCLYKTAKYEKVFFLIGSGSNGKSTFIHLLEAFLGLANISHETLQDLSGENKFSKAELFGKSANLYADLTRKSIKYTGTLKMLTSGDWMSAERKMQHRFQFRPYAKLVYSANQMPEIEDDSYAMHRRLVVLLFENVFESNKDTRLIDKLTTQEELSGLLNLALIALNQLIKDNGFAYIEDVKTVAKTYRRNANSVVRFLEERCIIDKTRKTLTTKLQNAYFNFCKEEGIHRKTDEELGKELPENVIKKRGPRPDRENYYYGIGLKEEDNNNPSQHW